MKNKLTPELKLRLQGLTAMQIDITKDLHADLVYIDNCLEECDLVLVRTNIDLIPVTTTHYDHHFTLAMQGTVIFNPDLTFERLSLEDRETIKEIWVEETREYLESIRNYTLLLHTDKKKISLGDNDEN